jgi:hypothetical protein
MPMNGKTSVKEIVLHLFDFDVKSQSQQQLPSISRAKGMSNFLMGRKVLATRSVV